MDFNSLFNNLGGEIETQDGRVQNILHQHKQALCVKSEKNRFDVYHSTVLVRLPSA